MLDLEFFQNVGNGDKLVVEDEQTIRNYTDIPSILQYAGQEVTVDYHEYGDVKIKEDSGKMYWSNFLFKSLVNGVDPDTFEPQFAEKNVFEINFDVQDYSLSNLSRLILAKITDDYNMLTKFNSSRLSKIIKGKWVVINTSNGRVYSQYNPHLLLVENKCNNYRIDYHTLMMVDSKILFDNTAEYSSLEIDFENGTFKKIEKEGETCCCCGRPLISYLKMGKYCSRCLNNYTYRFGYHDYGDGYPVYEDVNTEITPVFGCEIERDYEEPERYYDEEEDDYDDYCDDGDETFDDNLSSATMTILKTMQGEQLEEGTLRREQVFMTDSSLNRDGLEWITFPHTFEWYVANKDNFDKTLKNISEYGFINTQSAGNHIHINRDYFTINGRDYSDFCASKIAILFAKYWEEFKALADRYDTGYTEKPDLEEEDSPFDVISKMSRDKHEHSVAVNLQHSKTVEIRLWSGIESADDLLFYLDNMQALAQYAKKVSLEKVQNAKMSDFMKYYKLETSLNEAYRRISRWGNNYCKKDKEIRDKVLKDVKRLVDKKGEQA